MNLVRQGLAVAIVVSTVAFTSTAMAGKGGVKGANPTAPGQIDSSPVQARFGNRRKATHQRYRRGSNTIRTARCFQTRLRRLDKHSVLRANPFGKSSARSQPGT